MKLIESLRFAVKCIKLSYNLKMNLVAVGCLFLMALVYEITDLNNGLGAFLLVIVAMYPAQMIYSICGSQLVQSSPYKKTIMTSLPTVMTFCCGIATYLLAIAIEEIRAIRNPEQASHRACIILLSGMVLLLMNIYIGIAFKYFVVSMIVMFGCIMGVYYLSGIIGGGTMILSRFPGISIPIAIAVGLCLAVLGSMLQYGISLLLYKRPISRRAIYGLLRQQA